MIQINDQLSDGLKVKPLEDGQFATYKLCDADLVDFSRVDDKTGKPRNNQPRRSLKGEVIIMDPFTKKKIRLRNIVSSVIVERNGVQNEEPKIERVLFGHNSVITIGPDDPGTYLFMERHPLNRDNPFRDKTSGKKPAFYRINAKKKAIQEMEYNYILSDALAHVVAADKIELLSIYKKLDPTSQKDINPEGTFEQLKRDTFALAKAKPEIVMKASSNKEAKAKLQIMDADYYRIIMFMEDEEDMKTPRRWVFVDGEEDICQVPIDENKYDGLLKFMFSVGIEDGKLKKDEIAAQRKVGMDAYQKMADRLRKIFKSELAQA